MLDSPPDSCIDEPGSPLCAADVARGVIRMLLRHDLTAMAEVPLDGGRRADLMAIDARGQIVVVEIEHIRDLLQARKLVAHAAALGVIGEPAADGAYVLVEAQGAQLWVKWQGQRR